MKKLFTLALSLIASTSFAQFVSNAGMEDWHTYTVDGTDLEAPDGWFGSDSAIFAFNEAFPILGLSPQQQIFQSTAANNGSSSARVLTADIGSIVGIVGGTLSNANISFSQGGITYEGGSSVTERVPYVNAWVRYGSGDGNDSGSLTVTAIVAGTNGDSIVGTGVVMIGETNTQFVGVSAAIVYIDGTVVPEKIQITFSSSGTTPEDGSTLRVDDVAISTLSTKNLSAAKVVMLHPNPSTGIVSIYNTLKEPVTIKAFSINGQEVASQTFTGNSQLDLTAHASGLYFYTVVDKAGQPIQHGKLSIAK